MPTGGVEMDSRNIIGGGNPSPGRNNKMSHDNLSDRGEPNLLLQEVGDLSDIASREQTHEAGWDPDQLVDPESPVEEMSDEDEADTDFENKSSEKTKNPVLLYLQELGSIPLLSREEELKLQKTLFCFISRSWDPSPS